MNRKSLCVGTVLFLFCFSIAPFGYAQETVVGVKIGDSFAYEFSAYFYPANSNVTIPSQLIEDNQTEWVRFTIVDVTNTTASYAVVQHLVNGTDFSSQNQMDIATGEGSFPIIRANISDNEPLYPSLEFSPSINETLTRNYNQSQRTILHVSWNDTDYIDAYFDQKTGMPVELHISLMDPVQGTVEYSYLLMDSNVWVIPEFPAAFVLVLLVASTFAAALLYKRTCQRKQ